MGSTRNCLQEYVRRGGKGLWWWWWLKDKQIQGDIIVKVVTTVVYLLNREVLFCL